MSDSENKPLRATFYMRGGHAIEIGGIKTVTMTSNGNGGYSAYSIKWMPGASPPLLSLSIPNIVAVLVLEDSFATPSKPAAADYSTHPQA